MMKFFFHPATSDNLPAAVLCHVDMVSEKHITNPAKV